MIYKALPENSNSFDSKTKPKTEQHKYLLSWILSFSCPSRCITPYKAEKNSRILILGCGIAGSSTALYLASQGFPVTVITSSKDPLDCSSYWAQGGIVYKSSDDSPQLLAHDVHKAGAGKSFDPAVQKLANEGPRCVEKLLFDIGNVPFQREKSGQLAFTLEASHSRPRIIYKADCTGKVITTSLLEAMQTNPNIDLITDMTAFELAVNRQGRCIGVFAVANESNDLKYFPADKTVLATGGLGDLYLKTSNPQGAQGSGIAMAAKAKAKLRNMEYMQFHPTTLYIPSERSFLLSEALRGEGAVLLNHKRYAFALDYHPLGELAPRDVVTRMILSEMERENTHYVYLDISHKPEEWVKFRFPTIYQHCLQRGIDITKEPMPVVPAAHYHCGGVQVNLNGETSVAGLYAAGEVACTGVHGANRLASTSLLEGLVWGNAIADTTLKSSDILIDKTPINSFDHGNGNPIDDTLEDFRKSLQAIMWQSVGPVRTVAGLCLASRKLKKLAHEYDAHLYGRTISADSASLRNALRTAFLLCQAALQNRESAGTHFVVDGLEIPLSTA